jgi:eukaryotic-like serine/threonine-protein kinase
MLTGQRAFQGKSQLSVASAILEKEPPPIRAMKPLTPPALDHTIKNCLAKIRDERWQTARDLALELKWVVEEGAQTRLLAQAGGESKLRSRLAWVIAAIATLLAIFFAFSNLRKEPGELISVRAFIPAPDKTQFAPTGIEGGPVTISLNGRLMVFAARDENGKQLLWVRPIDSASARHCRARKARLILSGRLIVATWRFSPAAA